MELRSAVEVLSSCAVLAALEIQGIFSGFDRKNSQQHEEILPHSKNLGK